MKRSGAVRPTATPTTDTAADYFLPDFCEPRMVLAVVLIAELLALMLAVARAGAGDFLGELARVSVFVQWSGLTSAAALCGTAPRLRRLSTPTVALAGFGLVAANVLVLSVLAVAVGQWLAGRGLGSGLFPLAAWPFAFHNTVIALLVTALLLRYCFVSHQWRRHVRAEASARIDALHARIRPHFLFNSLNTIASLTRSDAVRAEEAIEDLADLFRATLRDADATITLKEELELARIYQRMEALRLGDRLQVRWQVAALPMRMQVPSLIVQPLLENAINHGIEPNPAGGTVLIEGDVDAGFVTIAMSNPMPPQPAASRHGNRIALDNIRARLALAYGGRASISATQAEDRFRVEIRLPHDTERMGVA